MIKKNLVLLGVGILCLLFVACGDDWFDSDDNRGGVLPPQPSPLILAVYDNIHLERIPFIDGRRATMYGAESKNPTTVVFSMARKAEYTGNVRPQTFFNTIVRTWAGGNFDDFYLSWDNEWVNTHMNIGRTNNIVGGTNLSFIEGNSVITLPLNTSVPFSLNAGVRGEPQNTFGRIIGGEVLLYDWKHIRFLIDIGDVSNSVRASLNNERTINNIIESSNILFRQAAVHVSRTSRREDANVVLKFVDRSNLIDGAKEFTVRGDTVVIDTWGGSIERQAVVAMAIRFGLTQNQGDDRKDLMHVDNWAIVFWNDVFLSRNQWNTLNQNVR